MNSLRGRLIRIRDLLRRRGRGGKSVGQSLVEFTVLLPVLLMMLSGLIEFGFMLNYYLDLIDAAREAARFAAGDDPLRDAAGNWSEPNWPFYSRVQTIALQSLALSSDGRITIDCAIDDVIISAFGVRNGQVGPPPLAEPNRRFPTGWPNGFKYCGNGLSSAFTNAQIEARLMGAPDSGLVLIEIYYNYNMVLGLPWITAFVPNPIRLHAYSIMPNVNVEPTPTP
ncbi:MAG: TadE/TadG family type IV pilus assembly protein [Anaerolineales bacterium]